MTAKILLAAAVAGAIAAHPGARTGPAHGQPPPAPPAPPASGVKLGPGPHYQASPPQAEHHRDHDGDHDTDRHHRHRFDRFGGYEGAVWSGRAGERLVGEGTLAGEAQGLQAGPACGVMLHWSDKAQAAERRRVC